MTRLGLGSAGYSRLGLRCTYLASTALVAAAPSAAFAADYVVNDEAELSAAIMAANATPEDDSITLGANVTLTSALPVISDGVVIDGGGYSLAGSGSDRIFFVDAPGEQITIANFYAISGGVAEGGDGGTGLGGGGLGAGGAIYIHQGDVSLSGVSFVDNAVTGGTGVSGGGGVAGGGGGGLGGDGGDGSEALAGGGGGGFAGGGGGGGGATSDPGILYEENLPGRGGGGAGGAGGNGGLDGAGSAGFGGGAGGAPDVYSDPGYTQYVYVPGYSYTSCSYSFWYGRDCDTYWRPGYSYSYYVAGTGEYEAGGGGGGAAQGGGAGGNGLADASAQIGGGGGGGGGLSGAGGLGGSNSTGGDGTLGGGGGGASGTGFAGGDGGLFGGGGGAYGDAGSGGFGGGGGGSYAGGGGIGGFGGGGGGSVINTAGVGGAGAGSGSGGVTEGAGGGGGAGLGGAIFVGSGGSLSLGGKVNFSGSTAAGGAAGGSAASAGMGAGSDLFLPSGTTTFTPGAGEQIVLSGTIGDDSPWTLDGSTGEVGTGTGATIAISGGGSVSLAGTSTIAGGFTVDGSTLAVAQTGLITAPGVAVELIGAGALLDNAGEINGAWGDGASASALDINATVLVSASGTIENSGHIYAGGSANVAGIRADADLTLVNSGTIGGGQSASAPGGYGVVGTSGAALTIDNQAGASIYGGAGAIAADGTLDLTNAGTISSLNGIGVSAAAGSITNASTGSIVGTTAVEFTGGGAFSIESGGTMTGTDGTAIAVEGDGSIDLLAGSVTNGAIVTGATGTVAASLGGTLNGSYLGGAAFDEVILLSSASISGSLEGGAGMDSLTFAGTGSGAYAIGGTSGFEDIIVDTAGDWTITGSDLSSADWTIARGLATVGSGSINSEAGLDVRSSGQLTLTGNLVVGSLAGEAGGSIALANHSLTTGGNDSDTSFGGTISGTGGLVKQGEGVLTLSGTNTYSGATTINSGTLGLAGGTALADVGAVQIAAGATLELQASETVGSLSGVAGSSVDLGANTLTTGGNGGSTEFGGAIAGTGSLVKAGAGSLTLSGENTFTGSATVAAGALTLVNGAALADAAAVTVAAGATLDLHDSETIGSLSGAGTVQLGASTLTVGGDNSSTVFSGAITDPSFVYIGSWDVYGGEVWTSNPRVYTGQEAAALLFGGDPASYQISTISADPEDINNRAFLDGCGDTQYLYNPAPEDYSLDTGAPGYSSPCGTGTAYSAYIRDNGSGLGRVNYAFQEGSGGGALTKFGAGILTLSGVNTYSGDTLIEGGALSLANGEAILDTGAIVIGSGATLDLQNSEVIGSLEGVAGSLVTLGANTLTVGLNGTSTTFDGVISGTGNLVKDGDGTLTLGGSNTYSGGTTVTSGVLQLGAANVLSDLTDLTIAEGAALDLQAFNETVHSASISGTLDGTGTLTAASYALNGATINGNLGSGSLENVNGTSVLLGTVGAETILVRAGTLQLAASDRLSDTADVTVDTGAVLDLQAYSDTVGSASVSGFLEGSGTLIAATYELDGATINANLGAGALTNLANTSVLNGTASASTILVSGGTLQLGAAERLSDLTALTIDDGAALDLQGFTETVGTATISGTLAGTGLLNANSYSLEGATVNADLGAGTLLNTGGTSVLNGIAGATTVEIIGGTLQLGATDRLDDGAALEIASEAILDLQGFEETVGTAEVSGTLAGTGTLTASTYLLDGATIDADLGEGILTVTGELSTLNGTSAAEEVNLVSGTLQLGGDDRLLSTTDLVVGTGVTFDLHAYDQSVASAHIAGTLGGSGTLTAASYDLGGATIDANLGAGVLNQLGGISTLNGTSAAGEVNLVAGTLRLGGDDRLLTTTDLVIAPGVSLDLQSYDQAVASVYIAGTLAGTGTLHAPSYDLMGATIHADLGGGVLNQLGGSTTLHGLSYATEVNLVAGTLRLGGNDRLLTSTELVIGSGVELDVQTFNQTVGSAYIAGVLSGSGTLFAPGYMLEGALINANLGDGTLQNVAGLSILNGTAGAGMVLITAGTLQLGAADRLSDTADLAVGIGAILDVQGHSDTVGTAYIAGSLIGTGTLTAEVYGLEGAEISANLGSGAAEIFGGTSLLNGTMGAAEVLVSSGTLLLGADDRLIDTAVLGIDADATFDLAGYNETIAGLLGTGAIVLGGAGDVGTLTIEAMDHSNFGGSITGTGDVVKTGDGEFELSGTSEFAGRMTVADGLLTVNGSLLAELYVGAEGMLGGTGMISALTVDGYLAPGNSIGTLSIAGDLSFAAGSVYLVEVKPGLEGDRTDVGGAITVSSSASVEVLAGSGEYDPVTTYRILTAAGGIDGTFGSVTTNLAFLDPELFYTTNAVDLVLLRNDVDFAEYAITPNQITTAGAVQELGYGNALYNAVVRLSGEDAQGAFTQLSGEAYASVLSGITHSGRHIRNSMFESPEAGEGIDLWGDMIGAWGTIKANAGVARTETQDRYLIGGLDYRFGGARVGVAAGLQSGDFDSDDLRSKSDLESQFVGASAGLQRGRIGFEVGGAMSWHDGRTIRALDFGGLKERAAGEFDASSWQIFSEARVDLFNGPVRVQPFAGLTLQQTQIDGFSEAGGAAALTVGEREQDVTLSKLGLRLNGAVAAWGGTVAPKIEIGWQHGWGELDGYSQARFSTGNGFLFQGARVAEDAAELEFGLEWRAGAFKLGATFNGFVSDVWSEHGVTVSAGFSF